MPLHLPPSSRRRFLRTTLGAGVLASAASRLHAVPPSPDSETWALLSDTHIAADPATISPQGVNMADQLARIVEEICAEASLLSGVLVNGDCAHIEGLQGDYVTFAHLLRPLSEAGLPVHLTLGNHDDRGPFFETFASHRADPAPVFQKHVSVVHGPVATWVFLDSLREVNEVAGELGPEQITWLRGIAAESPSRPVLVAGHHYPTPFRDDVIPGDQKIPIAGLFDGSELLDLLDATPAVQAYFFGHSHDWGHRVTGAGCHLVNLPPTAYVFKPERPSGWVRLGIDSTALTLELRALDPSHPEHGQVVRLPRRV